MSGHINSPLVMLASGNEDGGKLATLVYTAACTSAAMGRRAQIFLAGDGSFRGYRGWKEDVVVHGFPPLEELMESFCQLGDEVYICSGCDGVCAAWRPCWICSNPAGASVSEGEECQAWRTLILNEGLVSSGHEVNVQALAAWLR